MRAFRYLVAEAPEQLADAQHLRFSVYCEEEQLLAGGQERGTAASTEANRRALVDACDDSPATSVLLVYAGHQAVGTIRLTTLAEASGAPTISAGPVPFAVEGLPRDARLAVVGRFCVRRRYRGTGVVATLYAGLCAESRRRRVEHWLALANAQTDCPKDAALAYRVAQSLGFSSAAARLRPAAGVAPSVVCTKHIYDAAEHDKGASGRFAELSLPPTLSLFLKRMGGRCAGPPVYDPAFRIFAFPLVATPPA